MRDRKRERERGVQSEDIERGGASTLHNRAGERERGRDWMGERMRQKQGTDCQQLWERGLQTALLLFVLASLRSVVLRHIFDHSVFRCSVPSLFSCFFQLYVALLHSASPFPNNDCLTVRQPRPSFGLLYYFFPSFLPVWYTSPPVHLCML